MFDKYVHVFKQFPFHISLSVSLDQLWNTVENSCKHFSGLHFCIKAHGPPMV